MRKLKDPRENELLRRRRVVHGWAFRDLPKETVAQIRAWTGGETDVVPEGWERLNEVVE